MRPLQKIDDENTVLVQSGPAAEAPDLRRTRDWARLIAVHIYVAGMAPFAAATLYSVINSDRATLLTGRGFIGYLALVACTYLFFGWFAIAGIIFASPVLALFSKTTAPWLGRLLAISMTGVIAWLIGGLSGVREFQIAAVLTTAFVSFKLEDAWRKTR
jgi:hypothetical protein